MSVGAVKHVGLAAVHAEEDGLARPDIGAAMHHQDQLLGAAASAVFAQAHAAGFAAQDDAAVFKLLRGK